MSQVKHTVLIRFRPDVAAAQVAAAMADLGGLKDRIPGIVNFSGGSNMSRGVIQDARYLRTLTRSASKGS